MKIGLYKIGRDISFINKPTTKIYQPIMKAFRDFLKRDHDVGVMTPDTYYDAVIVDTGVIADEKKLPRFNELARRVIFVDSDPYLTRQLPRSFVQNINNIVVFNDVEKAWFPNATVYTLPICSMLYTIVEKYANLPFPRKHGFYYGSEEKNRLTEILEYVYRPDPNIVSNLRLPSLGVDEWTTLDNYYDRLRRSHYTLMIEDKEYYILQQTTVRYYEALMVWTMPLATPGFHEFNKQFPRIADYLHLARVIRDDNVYTDYWDTLCVERVKFMKEYESISKLIRGII